MRLNVECRAQCRNKGWMNLSSVWVLDLDTTLGCQEALQSLSIKQIEMTATTDVYEIKLAQNSNHKILSLSDSHKKINLKNPANVLRLPCECCSPTGCKQRQPSEIVVLEAHNLQAHEWMGTWKPSSGPSWGSTLILNLLVCTEVERFHKTLFQSDRMPLCLLNFLPHSSTPTTRRSQTKTTKRKKKKTQACPPSFFTLYINRSYTGNLANTQAMNGPGRHSFIKTVRVLPALLLSFCKAWTLTDVKYKA